MSSQTASGSAHYQLRVKMIRTIFFATLVAAVEYAVAVPWKGEVRKVGDAVYHCKCYPDNPCWRTSAEWDALNKTVEGTLQIAVPPGAACHRSFQNSTVGIYSEAACAEVQANWPNEQWL